MKMFLSYCFDDVPFVPLVSYFLAKQPELAPFCYSTDKNGTEWRQQLANELKLCQVFVLFLGAKFGDYQGTELEAYADTVETRLSELLVVKLPDAVKLDDPMVSRRDPIRVDTTNEAGAYQCAFDIAKVLKKSWVAPDGLPVGYPFAYEKDIIDEYVRSSGIMPPNRIETGCPAKWPDVEDNFPNLLDDHRIPNPITQEVIGAFRNRSARMLVDARNIRAEVESLGESRQLADRLTFPEAGPRELLAYPRDRGAFGVGVLVSGGIAPGINAVIEGIVQRHELYRRHFENKGTLNHLTIYGYRDGFAGLLRPGANYHLLDAQRVREQSSAGGSMLGTSRMQGLLGSAVGRERDDRIHTIIQRLQGDGVDILYVIGGDGSMRAAHALRTVARKDWQPRDGRRGPLSVVGIPKTMDNDILWVWQSFGFLSAVEKAKEFVSQLYTETRSNPRLCVMQLFGSDSGFVVSHAALASGVCDAVLIPEVNFSMTKLATYIVQKLRNRFNKGPNGESPHGMILMAETAVPVDVKNYLDRPEVGLDQKEKRAIDKFEADGRRVHGQTPDELRTGSLKIVSRVLQSEIQKLKIYDDFWEDFRVFTSEPRHLLRAIPPSASDIIYGQRLGALAVDNAMAGYTDFMISQWQTEYVLVPLPLVVLGRKRVPQKGIFWKSVLANTGQPDDM